MLFVHLGREVLIVNAAGGGWWRGRVCYAVLAFVHSVRLGHEVYIDG